LNLESGVSVLLGNGDATFRGAPSYAVVTYPASVGAGDFNGDDIPDLGMAGYFIEAILLGEAHGSFAVAPPYERGGPLQRAGGVAVGDFNNDGYLDFAMVNALSDTVSIWLGKGDGSFQAVQNFAASSYPVYVGVGDFNGDSIADLAVPNSLDQGTVSVLLGNG